MIKQSSIIRRDTAMGKSEGRAQTLYLDLRLNLSTRKKLRDHEYEVRVFRIR